MRRTRAGSPVAWIVLGLVAVAALVIGALRAGGASTPEERIDAIARTVKCPVCPGESVYESRNSVALNIKADIAREVRAGQSDDQIRAGLSARYGEAVLLVPRADGIGAAVWVLPVAVFVAAVAGLVLAFRRWRRDTSAPPTDEDRALVEQALGAGVPGEPVPGEPVPSEPARAGSVRSGPARPARVGPGRRASTDPGGSSL
jgi:cytochrome c-type biogenesis protein CcmH